LYLCAILVANGTGAWRIRTNAPLCTRCDVCLSVPVGLLLRAQGWGHCRDELPSLEEALRLLEPSAQLGLHPFDQQPVTLGVGKFGPYVRHGKTNASIPKAGANVVLPMDIRWVYDTRTMHACSRV
jgi:hypothetical protein